MSYPRQSTQVLRTCPLLLIMLAVTMVLSCDDTVDDDGAVNMPQPAPNSVLALGGVEGDILPQSTGGEASVDMTMQADQQATDVPGTGGPCTQGDARCVSVGGTEREICSDGQWRTEVCPDEQLCIGARCVPNPVGCMPDERVCLSATEPAECINGMWQPLDPCPDDSRCSGGQCVSESCGRAGRVSSYLGCDYLAVNLTQLTETENAPNGIVLANFSNTESTFITVEAPDGQLAQLVGETTVRDTTMQGFAPVVVRSKIEDANGMAVTTGFTQAANLELPPGGLATLLVPTDNVPSYERSSIGLSAYRIRTTEPVVAYQFAPYCCNFSFSNDASLLFPVPTLGNRYRYVGVPVHENRLLGASMPPVIAVASPSDGVEVTIDLPLGARVTGDGTDAIPSNRQSYTVNLDRNELLSLTGLGGATFTDFSGATIQSDQPVAVFSVHACTFYPELYAACDHLQEQLFPESTWGRRFQLVPPRERGNNAQFERAFWKLVATDVSTVVTLSGDRQAFDGAGPGFGGVTDCLATAESDMAGYRFTLPEGGVCEFSAKAAIAIEASSPVMVMGIISGEESTELNNGFFPMTGVHAGDPSAFLVPPDSQYREDYVFLTPGTYERSFVTAVAPAGTQINIDGVSAQAHVMQTMGSLGPIPVVGSSYEYWHLRVDEGVHRLEGSAPFGILVYAFDDYVSYAFTGGLNLRKR